MKRTSFASSKPLITFVKKAKIEPSVPVELKEKNNIVEENRKSIDNKDSMKVLLHELSKCQELALMAHNQRMEKAGATYLYITKVRSFLSEEQSTWVTRFVTDVLQGIAELGSVPSLREFEKIKKLDTPEELTILHLLYELTGLVYVGIGLNKRILLLIDEAEKICTNSILALFLKNLKNPKSFTIPSIYFEMV